jgi:hypothetical protein
MQIISNTKSDAPVSTSPRLAASISTAATMTIVQPHPNSSTHALLAYLSSSCLGINCPPKPSATRAGSPLRRPPLLPRSGPPPALSGDSRGSEAGSSSEDSLSSYHSPTSLSRIIKRISATNIPIMGMSSPPSNKTEDSRGFRTPVASRYAPWTGEGHPRHRNRVGHGCQAEPNRQKHNNRFPERHWFPQAVTIGRTPFATRGGEEALLSLLALLPCRRLRWSSRGLLAALT